MVDQITRKAMSQHRGQICPSQSQLLRTDSIVRSAYLQTRLSPNSKKNFAMNLPGNRLVSVTDTPYYRIVARLDRHCQTASLSHLWDCQ
ncbi:hypothetical protein OLMES_0252 [Oleiphilus messinensis]|uniref:Uncharacterized protein n=1 Tax=Oleiphilus messinensis TaxID=141451 RepID=A0A1Y0I1L4_9GAMM|nr:hypothetical protein OLMES_0252 [Oleiphilus messinensis]